MGIILLVVVIGSFLLLVITGVRDGRALDAYEESHKPSKSGLPAAELNRIGSLISVRPQYGHGWVYLQVNPPHEEPEVPEAFEAELTGQFHPADRETQAGVAKIITRSHQLYGNYIAFLPRWTGPNSLEGGEKPYNVVIGPTIPDDNANFWKCIKTGELVLGGFATIQFSNQGPTSVGQPLE